MLGVALGASFVALVACSAPSVPNEDLGNGSNADTQPNKTTPPSGNRDTTETKGADASVPETAAAVCKTVAPNNRCGLVPQCGCGPNETCDVTNQTSGATSCVTAGGATLGRPCVQSGDCLAGLTCEYGACRPYCATPRTKCNVGGTVLCVEVLGDNKLPVPNNNICTLQCDPREPAAVCGTNSCHWLEDYYKPESVSDCNRPGTNAPYDDNVRCASDDDCQPGFACMNHPKYGLECERWCRLGVAGDCPTTPAGLVCTDAFAALAPVINGVKEGVCL
jgi:hypothetical protein